MEYAVVSFGFRLRTRCWVIANERRFASFSSVPGYVFARNGLWLGFDGFC